MNEEAQKYNVLLIEPSDIISEGLINIINKTKKFKIKDHITDLKFYNKNKASLYDIIIVDLLVVNYNDRYDIQTILLNEAKTVIIPFICNVVYEDQLIKQFNCLLYINDSAEQILKKIINVIDSTESKSVAIKSELSVREQEILIAVAKGKPNKEIANELSISVYTVITHRKNISHKLGINSTSGLTMYAIMNNLIDVSDFT